MKLFLYFFAAAFFLTSFILPCKKNYPLIKITFSNSVKGECIVLDSQYVNPFKEPYTISKLKYYISDFSFINAKGKVIAEKDGYHLITEGANETNSFSVAVKPGNYKAVSFLIGVDSIKNISGAQAGALDPLNGMFWTWNTGYIMFKIEGNSPKSNIGDNKFEYHIGGFSGSNNVLRHVERKIMPLKITKNSNTEVIIEADINKLWDSENKIKIAETPVCTTPGKTATGIANNYSKIFDVRYITEHHK